MSNAKMIQMIEVLAKDYKFSKDDAIATIEKNHPELFSKKFFDKKLAEKPINVFTNKVAEEKYNEFKISHKLPNIADMPRTGGKNNRQISKDDIQKAIENYSGFDVRILLSEKGLITVETLNISISALKAEYLKGSFKKTATGFINITSIKSWWKKASTETETSDCEESEGSESESESESCEVKVVKGKGKGKGK